MEKVAQIAIYSAPNLTSIRFRVRSHRAQDGGGQGGHHLLRHHRHPAHGSMLGKIINYQSLSYGYFQLIKSLKIILLTEVTQPWYVELMKCLC